MAKPFRPQIATGNDLIEGDVVYLTDHGTWSPVIWRAAIAHSAEEATELEWRAQAFPNQVVGVYLVETILDFAGRATPAHFREAFRMRGPSNYFHGKQAEDFSNV